MGIAYLIFNMIGTDTLSQRMLSSFKYLKIKTHHNHNMLHFKANKKIKANKKSSSSDWKPVGRTLNIILISISIITRFYV